MQSGACLVTVDGTTASDLLRMCGDLARESVALLIAYHDEHEMKMTWIAMACTALSSTATGLSNDSQASDQPDVAGRDVM